MPTAAADRDLKPANIFVLKAEDSRDATTELVKVVDFGIATVAEDRTDPGRPAPARLTVPGMVLGTAEYMSPEQAQGFKTDQRVDQYALGCILYEMLTGRVPHEGMTPAATMLKHITDRPVPPSQLRPDRKIPESLDKIVLTAMSVEPSGRFPSMKELEQALTEQLDTLRGRPQSTASLILPRMLPKHILLRRRLMIGGGVVGLLCLIGLGVVLARRTKPTPTPTPTVAPPPVRTIRWEIKSEPAGALVVRRVDQAVLGQTPWNHSQDEGTGTIEVELRKQGFQTKRLQLNLGNDENRQTKLAPEAPPVERKGKKSGKPAAGKKKGGSIRDNNDVPVFH